MELILLSDVVDRKGGEEAEPVGLVRGINTCLRPALGVVGREVGWAMAAPDDVTTVPGLGKVGTMEEAAVDR